MSTDPCRFGSGRQDLADGPEVPPVLAPLHSMVFMPHWSLLQPERINPELNHKGYNVKSDVWSLGITMVLPGAWYYLASWDGCPVSELLEGPSDSLGPRRKSWFHNLRRKCAMYNYGILKGLSARDSKPFPTGEGCPS